MRLQLDTILTAETVRRLEIQTQSMVDRLFLGVEKLTKLDPAGLQMAVSKAFGDAERIRSGKAHDTDPAPTRRCGYRCYGIRR